MPYVKRTVIAGNVIETKKMFTPRYGKKGQSRASAQKITEEAQAKVNERKLCEILRWKIEANFKENDFHAVLHYNDKPQTLEKIHSDLRRFLNRLRRLYRKSGKAFKYIAVIETKRMTNPHIHLIVEETDIKILAKIWKEIAGGRISNNLLDGREFHQDLAEYLMKESRSTAARNAGEKNKKRYWCSQNLSEPVIKYEVIPAASWKRDPKAKAGYYLYKYEDGSFAREGVNEVTGYAWMEYIQIRLC